MSVSHQKFPCHAPLPIYRNARFNHSVCFCVSISEVLLLRPQITASRWSAHRASSSSAVFRFTPSLFDYELLPVQRVPSVVIKDSWAVLLWKKKTSGAGHSQGRHEIAASAEAWRLFERRDWGRKPQAHQWGGAVFKHQPWGRATALTVPKIQSWKRNTEGNKSLAAPLDA